MAKKSMPNPTKIRQKDPRTTFLAGVKPELPKRTYGRKVASGAKDSRMGSSYR